MSKYCESIPKEYLCPISNEIMLDPVICENGYSYDRSSIGEYETGTVISNINLKNIIHYYIENYKPNGNLKKTLPIPKINQNVISNDSKNIISNNNLSKKISIGYNYSTDEIIEVDENIEIIDITKYYKPNIGNNNEKSNYLFGIGSFKNLDLLKNLKKIILLNPRDLLLFNAELKYLEEIYFNGAYHESRIGQHGETNLGKIPHFSGIGYTLRTVYRNIPTLIYPNLKKIVLSEHHDCVLYNKEYCNFNIEALLLIRVIRTKNIVNIIFENKNIKFITCDKTYQAVGIFNGYNNTDIYGFNDFIKKNLFLDNYVFCYK